jgi:tRNA U34 2-thiouridine synthase MnmA/TrmU
MKTLRPFSGPEYKKNSKRGGEGTWPCALCGKPVKEPSLFIEVTNGGATFVKVGTVADENDPGYMGCHRVGSDCAKKLKKAGFAVYEPHEPHEAGRP